MLKDLYNIFGKIRPYVFNEKNTYRLGGIVLLTSAGMGLDFLLPNIIGQTFAFLATNAATTTTLFGMEMGAYELVATGMAVYGVRNLAMNYRNDALTMIGPRAVGQLFVDYARHARTRSLQDQRTVKIGDDVICLQKGYTAIIAITNKALGVMLPMLGSTVFSASVISWRYGTAYGAGLLGLVVVGSGYQITTTPYAVKLRNQGFEAGNNLFDDVLRANQYCGVIQKNTAETTEEKRVQASQQKWANLNAKSESFALKIARRQEIMMCLALTGLSLLAVHSVRAKKMDGADYATLFTLYMQFISNINGLCMAASEVFSSIADFKLIFSHFEKPSGLKNPLLGNELKLDVPPTVRLENVFFSVNGKPILKGVSFTAPSGKKTVIVGSSGAGKSTIAHLIDRSLEPHLGRVYFDNVDILNCELKSIRAKISTVEQEPTLFNASIRENIEFGCLVELTAEKLQTLIEIVSLAELIKKLPNGVETEVGENGKLLSGGEKQRVAIARALARNPLIIIGDEATSALDPFTKRKIDAMLDRFPVTLIKITHQLEPNADHIVVMKDGVVVEQGKHEELLQKNGEYATLWHKQHTPENDTASIFAAMGAKPSTPLSPDDEKPHRETPKQDAVIRIAPLELADRTYQPR